MDSYEAYAELIRRSKEHATLASCSSLLGWDEQTFMPAGGAAHRSAQMGLLAGIHHEQATDPRIGELLAIVESSDLVAEPASPPAVNAREIRRSYDRRVRLPQALVEELARTTSLAQPEWVAARSASDFARFRPWLEKIIQLKRHESACLARQAAENGHHVARPSVDAPPAGPTSSGGSSSYDPLLDEFEPGATTHELAVVFQAVRRDLIPLAEKIAEACRRKGQTLTTAVSCSSHPAASSEVGILNRFYPRDRQQVFGELAAAAVGFDFHRGRLDVTAHPFCSGIGPGDCRITTRYDEHNFSDAFFGILHEVGHGLYEQGLDPEQCGTPMGEAVSLGIHESQSRLWENGVARSRPFWNYWFPIARRIFRGALGDVTLDAFHAAVNQVAPSLIRVQADEVTYNLHIIIRFELEQAMLSGDLPTAEVPAAWNQKYKEALGLLPGNDAVGCLQDIHWSAGLIGYFPTYTLGNLYAAQLFARAQADLAGLDQAFRTRRLQRPPRMAAHQGSSPGPALPARGINRAGLRLEARPSTAHRGPHTEILRAVWRLIHERNFKRPCGAYRSSGKKTREVAQALPALRLASIDAYRGLVMFLMMAEVLRLCEVARKLPGQQVWELLCHQQSHVEWTGCSLHDLIQPSFSFLVGVALPFSLVNRLAKGQSKAWLTAHALWRSLVLVLLGVFLRSRNQGQTYFTFEDTLSQIGLGYTFLFLLALFSARVQWIALGVLLAGYWAAFALYPGPPNDFDFAKVGVASDWAHHPGRVCRALGQEQQPGVGIRHLVSEPVSPCEAVSLQRRWLRDIELHSDSRNHDPGFAGRRRLDAPAGWLAEGWLALRRAPCCSSPAGAWASWESARSSSESGLRAGCSIAAASASCSWLASTPSWMRSVCDHGPFHSG